MNPTIENQKRIEILYWDGNNDGVSDRIAKKEELYYSENVRFPIIGQLEKRRGYVMLGNELSSPTNYGLTYFNDTNASSKKIYRVTKVGASSKVYYLNTSSVWTAMANSPTMSNLEVSSVVANDKLFIVNGTDSNFSVSKDGTTVVLATSASGNLYNSSKAKKITSYKDKLYLADYYDTGGVEHPIGVSFSSLPLGIVSLVSGDHIAGVTTLNVTETKYIYPSDTLDVYRGDTLIQTITVTAKTDYTLTVTATTAAINSSDELWVASTKTGAKIYRWAPPKSGVNVKQYDTFSLSGAGDSAITLFEPIGDYLAISNKNNFGFWNESSLKTLDLGIGCVSTRGYGKCLGSLYFIGYDGVFRTSGDFPTLISAKVQRYFDGATKAGLEASTVSIYGNRVLFYIGNVSLYKEDGSLERSISSCVLEYNVQQQNWVVHSGLPMLITLSGATLDTNQKALLFSHTTGHIYSLFDNTSLGDVVSTTSTLDIPTNITTIPLQLSKTFENYCYPKEILLDIRAGSNINVFVSLDGEDYYPLAQVANKGANIIKVHSKESKDTGARCRKISVSLRENSSSVVRVAALAINYVEAFETEGNQT